MAEFYLIFVVMLFDIRFDICFEVNTWMLCISTSFQVLAATESWSKHKKSKKSTKKRQFRGTPSGSRPAFACRPALRSRQNHIFLVHFHTFFVDFSREITDIALK